MKTLLSVTAVLETVVGIGLVVAPTQLVALLSGATLDGSAALVVARLAGGALLSLALACWIARGDERSKAARGVVSAMLLYNLAASAVFIYAALVLGLTAFAIWPIAIGHGALAGWCAVCLRSPHSG